MKVYFVCVYHGPHSGIINTPVADARIVTQSLEKAKQYLAQLVETLEGGCKGCGTHFQNLIQLGASLDRVMGTHHDFPWQGEDSFCKAVIIKAEIEDDLGVLPYIQREMDIAFHKKRFSFGLKPKSDEELNQTDYTKFRKAVDFDKFYEEGIVNEC